jgi:NAD(P)-dependent dehydrogenase (short-subunit alcohol dehydrogenase family)
MQTNLNGRIAFVTGGASGLGRATCLALAEEGVHVVAADVNTVGAEATAQVITDRGGTAEALAFDVTSGADRRAAMDDLFGRFGSDLDILVNVAGIDRPGYLVDVDEDAYLQVFAVNCHGPVFLMKEFLNHFIAVHEDGPEAEIFNVLSISAVTVGSGAVAYNSSKAAFTKATEIFQTEVREFAHPCRIQAIMPAAMDTPMMEQWGIPKERMMDPADVAAEIVHALRRPTTTLGQNLVFTPRVEYFPR